MFRYALAAKKVGWRLKAPDQQLGTLRVPVTEPVPVASEHDASPAAAIGDERDERGDRGDAHRREERAQAKARAIRPPPSTRSRSS